MATEAETLLQAEQAATRLIDDLEELKKHTGGYGRARGELEAIRADAQKLIGEVSALTARAKEIIGTMGAIGTPELLSRIDAARTDSKSAAAGVAEARAVVQSTGEAVRALAIASRADAEQTQRAVSDAAQATKQSVAEHAAGTTAVQKAETAQVTAALTTIRGRLMVTLGISVLAAVLAAVAVILLVARMVSGH